MPSGFEEPGSGEFGDDDPDFPVPVKRGLPATALKVVGASKDYVAVDGALVAAHWVDVAAFNALRFKKSSIRSEPEIGETISKSKYIDKDMRGLVEDRVLLAWDTLIKGGYLRFVGVTIDLRVKGRVYFIADYINLVLGRPDKISASI